MKRLIIMISVLALPALAIAGTSHITSNLDVSGTLTVDGATTLTGAITATSGLVGDVTGAVAGNITGDVSGNVTGDVTTTAISIDGTKIDVPTAVVQLDTATALGTLDSFVIVVGSNAASGAFPMTSAATPFISTTTATAGQEIMIMGSSATGTVTLSDNGTVSGSLLELDGTTITLGLGSNITLRYYSGKWYQCGGINTID